MKVYTLDEIVNVCRALPKGEESYVATLATIPGRYEELKLCLDSLCPQMNMMIVALNYANSPLPDLDLLCNGYENVYFTLSDNELGDAMKFCMSQNLVGYQFMCDDDLVYPPDYARIMVAKLKEHNRKCVVGLAGSIISCKLESYYNGRHMIGHALRTVAKDTLVNVISTGAMAFHSELIKVPMSAFKHRNMADVMFAVYCQEYHTAMLCMAHDGDWLKYPDSMRSKDTIWNSWRKHDTIQAEYANMVENWQVWPSLESKA